jgi:hypothetical protein
MVRGRTILARTGTWHLVFVPLLVMLTNGFPRQPPGTIDVDEDGVPYHTVCNRTVTDLGDGLYECPEHGVIDTRPKAP